MQGKLSRLRCMPMLALALVGCTFVIRPSPCPYVEEDKIPISVGLVIDDAQAMQTHSTSCLCMIGAPNTWRVETGTALRAAAERTFSAMFTEVTTLRSTEQPADRDVTLLATPRIQQFRVTQDLAAEMQLNCRLVARDGKVLYDKTIPARGADQAATGCLQGAFGGVRAITETSNDAFNKAFQTLSSDIRETVDFTPYLE